MPIVTSQQISRWYELYKTIDVTFTKEIMRATGLDSRGVYLKIVGEQWPCVLHSGSFAGAKIVASSKAVLVDRIKHANNMVSLRLSFKLPDKPDPRAFFIGAKVVGYTPYTQGGGDIQFANLVYTQQPPDDYIEIMGRLLEAHINSSRRRDDRILLSPDAMRRMNLSTKDSVVFVQGVPRKCILRDLSFSGAKAIIFGLAKFLVGKECTLRFDLDEPRELLDIKGTIVRYEDVEGRKDLTAIAVHFDEQAVPISFKMHVNDCLSQQRPVRTDEGAEQAAAPPRAAPRSAPKQAVPKQGPLPGAAGPGTSGG